MQTVSTCVQCGFQVQGNSGPYTIHSGVLAGGTKHFAAKPPRQHDVPEASAALAVFAITAPAAAARAAHGLQSPHRLTMASDSLLSSFGWSTVAIVIS
jgi:hypothetical protein